MSDMSDDHDADVGPASDREDLFRPAPGSDPDAERRTSPRPPAQPGDVAGGDDDPDAPMFPPVAGGSTDAATGEDAGGDPAARTSSSRGPGGPDRSAEGQSRNSNEAAKGSASSFFRELPVLLLVAFLLAFVLRTFVLQVFFIPSGSMEPTLQIDDRMVVEKITYLFREPERGEVVVFEGESLGVADPDATAGERVVRGVGQFLGVVPASARDFVKRVIGLPGDEVVIEAGQVRVNGELLAEPYVVFEDLSDFGPVTVPDGHLFFLGDNRPNSADSRRGLGFVPTEAVVGRSVVVIWPFENVGLLTGVRHDLGASPDSPESLEPSEPAEVGDEAA